MTTEKPKVTCPLCGRETRSLKGHLRLSHGTIPDISNLPKPEPKTEAVAQKPPEPPAASTVTVPSSQIPPAAPAAEATTTTEPPEALEGPRDPEVVSLPELLNQMMSTIKQQQMEIQSLAQELRTTQAQNAKNFEQVPEVAQLAVRHEIEQLSAQAASERAKAAQTAPVAKSGAPTVESARAAARDELESGLLPSILKLFQPQQSAIPDLTPLVNLNKALDDLAASRTGMMRTGVEMATTMMSNAFKMGADPLKAAEATRIALGGTT